MADVPTTPVGDWTSEAALDDAISGLVLMPFALAGEALQRWRGLSRMAMG